MIRKDGTAYGAGLLGSVDEFILCIAHWSSGRERESIRKTFGDGEASPECDKWSSVPGLHI